MTSKLTKALDALEVEEKKVRCLVCQLPAEERAAIVRALARDVTQRQIAEAIGLGQSTLSKHLNNHTEVPS